MILGVGIDLVEVSRIRESLARFGDRLLTRILNPEEAGYCRMQADPALHVAARFAAKEAVSKALGTGIGGDLGWHDMEVGRLPSGQPTMELRSAGLALGQARGVARIHLSLTHSANTAAAVAILEG